VITVATLTPSLDLTYVVDSITPGTIHRTAELHRVAGGKGLNMARAARTMGASVFVVALLGGPTGRLLADLLDAEGFEMVTVNSGVDTRTCVSVSATDTGQLTEVYQDAKTVPTDRLQAYAAVLAENLAYHPGWLTLSGRAPTGAPGLVPDLVGLGQRLGRTVAVDTHSEALASAVKERPGLVKVNRAEAAELLGCALDADLAELARSIASVTGGPVVLTDGADGAVGCLGEVTYEVSGPHVIGHFPVGSGDSFFGGLVAGLDSGADLGTALQLAAGCGMANAMRPGQGVFDRAEAERLAGSVRLRRT
jgi:1-phosphofructokinase family hexose kinase